MTQEEINKIEEFYKKSEFDLKLMHILHIACEEARKDFIKELSENKIGDTVKLNFSQLRSGHDTSRV